MRPLGKTGELTSPSPALPPKEEGGGESEVERSPRFILIGKLIPVGNPHAKLPSFLGIGRVRGILQDALSGERREGRPPTSCYVLLPPQKRTAGRVRRVSDAPVPGGTAPDATEGSGGRRCSLLPPLARRLEFSHTCFPRQPRASSSILLRRLRESHFSSRFSPLLPLFLSISWQDRGRLSEILDVDRTYPRVLDLIITSSFIFFFS